MNGAAGKPIETAPGGSYGGEYTAGTRKTRQRRKARTFCVLCNKSVSSSYWLLHVKSKAHVAKYNYYRLREDAIMKTASQPGPSAITECAVPDARYSQPTSDPGESEVRRTKSDLTQNLIARCSMLRAQTNAVLLDFATYIRKRIEMDTSILSALEATHDGIYSATSWEQLKPLTADRVATDEVELNSEHPDASNDVQ